MTENECNPEPWAIDPDHGRVRGPGYLGDAFHSLRVRELFRYYQPPEEEDLGYVAPINTGNDFVKQSGLMASADPILAAFANLTTRQMDMRRCVVSMTGAGTSYIIAESTRSLSLAYPHTHEPGDALMLGGGMATSSVGGLCEHTCSLLPPPPDSGEPFLLEIPDLSKHPKFYNVGYVRNWPHARFYCGAPMRTRNGVTIGTVCVMDDRPRYDGLTERERMIMSNMADLFMQYLETKEGDRFRKKGQMMEMGLSRFIAEGFLPNEGQEISERRNGKLWSESILETRRQKEEERRKKVQEKRQTLQELEYVKMVMENRSGPLSHPASQLECSPCTPDSNDSRDLTTDQSEQLEDLQSSPAGTVFSPPEQDTCRDAEKPGEEVPVEAYVPIVHPLQPGLIEMVPADLVEERISLLKTVGTELSASGPQQKRGVVTSLEESLRSSSFSNDRPSRRSSGMITFPESRFESAASPLEEKGPETNASSSVSGTLGTQSESLPSTTVATTMTGKTRRSKYEETTSIEPIFRTMFARASTVIKNTIDCDVVFVDGDFEGFFEPELEGDPYASEDWGWSHVSSDNKAQSMVRATRPKQHRQKSGILGYATSKGASSARLDGPKRITDLGFDMSELNEQLLALLLKDSRTGKIFSFFDEYPGLEEHEDPEELECKTILQKFLPGCRSVIIVPLYDHNDQLSSVCFAWTCSDRKTFYGDEEGRFVTGVATSVMDEMARTHILSADKAKSEFISSISHELRSPLHGILASAEFLLDGHLIPDQRSFVETILSCGTTLLDTVNHVLDFQKLNFFKDEKTRRIEAPSTEELDTTNEEQSRTPKRSNSRSSRSSSSSEENLFDTKCVGTDFSTIVQEVTEGTVLGYEFKDLAKVFGQPENVKAAAFLTPTKVSNIQVVIDIEERDAGWVFLSSPAAIKRIVSNIVGNAIKYSNETGWIKITLSAKTIEPASNGAPRAKVSFIVSDSGKGMSREFLKTKLFTPFSQENPLANGAGLGLSIVRQLVEMLGGKIDVKSQLGKGTTIRVDMKLTQPIRGAATKLEPQSNMLLSRTAGKKALLIGFERFEFNQTPEQRGQTFLFDSITKYSRELLGMEVIFDPGVTDARDVQVIIVNEMSAATGLQGLPILKHCPVILMCNSTPRRSLLKDFQFDRDERLFTFMRKPCGPKKLMRAFQFCFDILEKGLPPLPLAIDQGTHLSLLEAASSPAVATHPSRAAASAGSFTSLGVAPLVSPELSTQCENQTVDIPLRAAPELQPQPTPDARSAVDSGYISTAPSPAASSVVLPSVEAPTSSERPVPAVIPTKISPATVPVPAIADAVPRQPKILCVEDNKINMMLLTTYMKKKKYPFKTAMDGAEAVERVKEEAFDGGFHCILMDLQMPIMSGIESTREIRSLEKEHPERFKPTFIIALTGLAASSDRRDAFDAGVDAFMVKPVSFKDLEKILDEHVRKGIMLQDGRAPEAETKRHGSIVSMESSRGKHIEIKRIVSSDSVEINAAVDGASEMEAVKGP
ncbi:hypothetical protein GQ43DRAFT_472710 [Delitschia confertaspora ATCC 74209]|uniref:histidine kinase n=1 Tax=Delitschia confertaspora ATCC 74209 TaxID=1513339 RepID=A0A9P4JPY3_9PLEO|nr:hypothetical protein GQ43DRAFT_472710 [Delitschia confertaspora ATCC 74209]